MNLTLRKLLVKPVSADLHAAGDTEVRCAAARTRRPDGKEAPSAGRAFTLAGGLVDGHQDLPSDGHEVAAKAITEGDWIRWSSRCEICSERRFCASFQRLV
jgi:hypothetical protein